MNKELTEEERKCRVLFNSNRDGILYLDGKGQVVDVNETFVRMSGYTRDEIKSGIFPNSICRSKTHEMLIEHLGKVIGNGMVEPLECQMIPRTGGSIDMEVEVRAVFSEQGDHSGFWLILRDITSRKTLERLYRAEMYLTESSLKLQSLEETLKAGVLAILDATGLDAGMAGFLDEEEKHFTLAFSYGVSDEFVEAAIRVVSTDNKYKEIQASGPVYTRYDELPISRDDIRNRENIKAVAIVPIFEDGELIGGVNVGSHTMEEIPRESRFIIESLVNQMGRAISRHRLLMAYKESEELYRALVESSPDSILVRDLDDNIIMASRSAVEMHGYDSEEEMLGRSIIELVAERDVESVKNSMEELKEKGTVLNRELEIIRKDGSRTTIEASGSLVYDINGVPKAILTTSRDITERKMTEERLQKINSELEGYAHMVSHDLRGPVSNIILGSDIVDKIIENLPDCEEIDELREVIYSMRGHAGKALELIQELLELAEAGQEPLNIVEVDLNKIVEEVIEELLRRKKVRVELDDDMGTIRANSAQMYQLFSNLIQNAVKHNDKDDLLIEVRRLSPRNEMEQRYLVRDNGSGIPAELTPDVFGPFTRNGKLKKGMGLSIVDKIVRAYEGEIMYSFQDGACFEISFPNAPAGQLPVEC